MDQVSGLELDASQRDAAGIDASIRQIVIAPAGSGKTQVLAALADRLVNEEDLDPYDELLVLSFSRAAIHAARHRLVSDADGVPPAPRTIDSLASAIIGSAEREVSGDFEARIRRATALVREGAWEDVGILRHVIVDEVQDVVGRRAEFVLAILESIDPDCGFTLLGDPAQGIYDFQLGPDASMTSSELLDAATTLGSVRRVGLTGQYRAESRATRAAVVLRDAVLDGDPEDELGAFEDDLALIDRSEDLVALLPRYSGSTAVLTATNGDALVLNGLLASHGLECAVRASAMSTAIDSRIARVLATHPNRTIEMSEFDTDSTFGAQRGDVWRRLKRISDARGGALDIRGASRALQAGHVVPEDLKAEETPKVVVSTVHRAKGLEFDNVVFHSGPRDPDEDMDARARTHYVAMTRSRRQLVMVRSRDRRNLAKEKIGGRWVVRSFRNNRPTAIEFRPDDIDRTRPVGGEAGQSAISAARPSDVVELELDLTVTTLDSPVYRLVLKGQEVARTSTGFGDYVSRRFGAARTRSREYLPWPEFSRIHVTRTETVCGDTQASGVGRWGMWLGVQAVGLMGLKWRRS